MRLVFCSLIATAIALPSGASAEDLQVKGVTVSIEPMTFYSGQRNRFPHWGKRMDCPTSRDRRAGARGTWLQELCGAKATQKPIVKQVGGTTSGGSCGYARYAVACVRLP